MERGEEKVARLVPREDPAGPVASMGGGSQTDDQKRGGRVAEPGQRARPVRLVREATRRIPGGLFTPCDEAGTTPARDDLAFEPEEVVQEWEFPFGAVTGRPVGRYFLAFEDPAAGIAEGTPIDRQRRFFSSQSSSVRFRLTAAAPARRSSSLLSASGGVPFGGSSGWAMCRL